MCLAFRFSLLLGLPQVNIYTERGWLMGWILPYSHETASDECDEFEMIPLRGYIITVIVIISWLQDVDKWQPFLQNLYNGQSCPDVNFIRRDHYYGGELESQIERRSPVKLFNPSAETIGPFEPDLVVKVPGDTAWWPQMSVSGLSCYSCKPRD